MFTSTSDGAFGPKKICRNYLRRARRLVRTVDVELVLRDGHLRFFGTSGLHDPDAAIAQKLGERRAQQRPAFGLHAFASGGRVSDISQQMRKIAPT